MSEQDSDIVRRLIEDHWNRKQGALVGELFASSVSLHTPDGELAGLEGASYLLQAYTTAFPDFHLAVHEMISEGDRVVVRYTFTGTHLGPLAGIPATGKRVSVANGTLIFRLTDAKVSEGHFLWDKYALLQQIGALASTAPAGA